MEAKPTPGPWTLDFDTGHVDGANEEIVCYLARGPSDETKANGHLIAAAPELLDALEALVIAYEEDVRMPGWVEDARAAIARAKGE